MLQNWCHMLLDCEEAVGHRNDTYSVNTILAIYFYFFFNLIMLIL